MPFAIRIQTYIHHRFEVERCAVPEHELAGMAAGQQPPALWSPSYHDDRLLRFSDRLMKVSHRDRVSGRMGSTDGWNHLCGSGQVSFLFLLSSATRDSEGTVCTNSHPLQSLDWVFPPPCDFHLGIGVGACASIVPSKSHNR